MYVYSGIVVIENDTYHRKCIGRLLSTGRCLQNVRILNKLNLKKIEDSVYGCVYDL